MFPVCPEVLGGLPTPRCHAEIVNGVVINNKGVSVDKEFRAGAEKALAVAKEKHSMRFTYFRGLSQVSKWVRLKFAAMNLKKYAIHLSNRGVNTLLYILFDKYWLITA